MRITGRLPKRSLHAPNTGKNRNCMRFQANPKYPVMLDARTKSPPSNHLIKSGNTGAMIPNARKSSRTVTVIKAIAALDPDGAAFAAAEAGNCSVLEGVLSRSAMRVRF